MIHVGIIGSRDWVEFSMLNDFMYIIYSTLNEGVIHRVIHVHTGDCPTGIDFFIKNSFPLESRTIHEADWKKHGKAAGPIRNKELINACDILFVFQKNNSR